MRHIKFVCLLLGVIFVIPALSKKPKSQNGLYIAGMSASFTDSLIFFTDVQYVDSATLYNKYLLFGRAQYSNQLKVFLEQTGKGTDRTCFVYFDKKKKNLQKKMNKIRQKYQKNKNVVINDVDSAFKFKKAEVY